MNQDMMINHLAHITGKSRKEVIAALKRMSQMPEVKKFLKDEQERRKTAS
jgi:DNA-binding transcriptional regulator GbsR (MarR family)